MRARRSALATALVVFAALVATLVDARLAVAAVPPSTPARTWSPQGRVDAIARSGDTVYMAGDFQTIGPTTGHFSTLDAAGAADEEWPQVTGGLVFSVIDDGTGGWFIGGSFTAVGGVPVNHLAHIESGHTLDASFAPNPSSAGPSTLVYSLARSGNTLYAGGSFTNIGGEPRNGVAALDVDTGDATTWDPDAGAGLVVTMQLSGSTLYVGGIFSAIGSDDRQNIAAIDTTTGNATSWSPGTNGLVLTMLLDGSTLYAGGLFSTAGGEPRANIAALDTASDAAKPFDPGADDQVWDLELDGSTLYVGGQFDAIGGQDRSSIAALDVGTGLVTSWAPQPVGPVYSIARSGTSLHFAGQFETVGGLVRNNIAAVDVTTGAPTSWDPRADAFAYRIIQNGSGFAVGGTFGSVGGVERFGLAAIDATTGHVTDWDPDMQDFNGYVNAIAATPSAVFIGGSFADAGGAARANIASLDPTTGAATEWNPGADNVVEALAVDGDNLYVGGFFGTLGSQTRQTIGAISISTGVTTSWNPSANFVVYDILVVGPDLYVAGGFDQIDGAVRNRIASFDTTTGDITAWDPDASSDVVALAHADGVVYAGGYFSSIGGAPRAFVAALDPSIDTNMALSGWDPAPNDVVRGLATSGSTVFVAGDFDEMSGITRNGFAAIEADGSLTDWDPGATQANMNPANGKTVTGSTDTVYVGGDFRTIGARIQQGFAAFDTSALSINNVTVTEGDTANFTASLSSAADVEVTVDYHTQDVTADDPADYMGETGTLTFEPGDTSETITIDTSDNSTHDPDRTFSVILSNASGAGITDANGTGTIQDNDAVPTLTINDPTVDEGGQASFQLTATGLSSTDITVTGDTADDTAGTSDYSGTANQTFTIPAGSTTSNTIDVSTTQDATDEPDEMFTMQLSGASSDATLNETSGTATITDDDQKPSLTINDAGPDEGQQASFQVTASNPSSTTITVTGNTADGTAGSSDYTGASDQTFTIPAGSTTSNAIHVSTTQDAIHESDETFTMALSNVSSNATLADDIGTGTIANDEPAPSLSINDVAAKEGKSGYTNFVLTVTLSGVSGSDVTFNYATADGTAKAVKDYTAIPTTGGAIQDGATTTTITVQVKGDKKVEKKETFFLNLSNATNASISDAQGVVTIKNDDR